MICFVNITAPDDMRFFQSSRPLSWRRAVSAPSWWRTSSPRRARAGSSPGRHCGGGDVIPATPGAVDRFARGRRRQQGGLRGWVKRLYSMLSATSSSSRTNSGSSRDRCCGKALTAQAVFNNEFLLPFAPDAPISSWCRATIGDGAVADRLARRRVIPSSRREPAHGGAEKSHAAGPLSARDEPAVRPRLSSAGCGGLPDIPWPGRRSNGLTADRPVRLRRHLHSDFAGHKPGG